MSNTKISENELHAYVDGELPPERVAEVEAYLASMPEVAQRIADYRRNDEALRARFDPVLGEPVPERLVQRRNHWARPVLRYAAVVGWITLGGIAGWHLHGATGGEQSSEAPTWARRAAIAHAVYSPEIRHPVEVGADQEAHLVTWLSKRLGTQLRIPQLNSLGYSLVGGRLLPGDHAPVAQFMYQDGRGQRLTLYVRTNREQSKETAFRFAQDGGVRVFYWIDRGLGLALSGEIGKEELLRVATAVYQQLNP
jgi:anti-sigma factor RsiW